MRVLLTGASGFLGRHVLQILRHRGIETVALGRGWVGDQAGVRWIHRDLLQERDFPALLRESNVTHLLHLAWYSEHGLYWSSPVNLRWVEASVRLVEAFCEAGGQRVVVAGTCAEYDWSEGWCREESTPLQPASLYGAAKDATRRLLAAVCAQYQVPCLWGRVFFPFGFGEAGQRLIPSLLQVFQGHSPPFGVNADACRDLLHASDVAEGFVALLHQGQSAAYNISSGQPVRLGDVVCTLARLLDADPQVVLRLTSARPGEPPLLAGDNSRIKALGWEPVLSWERGLERTVRDALFATRSDHAHSSTA